MKRIILSVLLLVSMLLTFSCAGNPGIEEETEPPVQNPPASGKIYAADLLFDGEVKSGESGDLTVAFMGSNAIRGTIKYDADNRARTSENPAVNEIINYYYDQFPNRNIKFYDSGLADTGSGYVSAFAEAVAFCFNPDIVFMEFTSVDYKLTDEEIEKNFDEIVAQANRLEKVPVLCMIISAPALTEEDIEYANWRRTADTETRVAEKYGIPVYEIYPFIMEAFENSGEEDFKIWRAENFVSSDYRPYTNEMFRVMGRGIVKLIDSNPAEFYKKLPEGDEIEATLIAPDSDRLTYEGEWTTYNYSNNFYPVEGTVDDFTVINDEEYQYPHAYLGIKETAKEGSAVSFKSSADSFAIRCLLSFRGAIMSVYVDGEYYCSINTSTGDRKRPLTDENLYPAVVHNVVDDWQNGCVIVDLPADGKEHDIKISADSLSGRYLNFRFSYIVEKTAVKKAS